MNNIMSFKTGGFKTKYIDEYGYSRNEYTIYCAEESCSETCVYKMLDKDGNEHDISIGAETVFDDMGNHSLIDCLYYLKNHSNKTYKYHEFDIIIEEMTDEDMHKVFGR